MPVNIGRKQSIEELTDGRIKKKGREEAQPTGRGRETAAETSGKKGGRGR